MAHVQPSSISIFEESPECSSSDDENEAKIGRPNKWTAPRQRKLARLYIFSRLPPKDIAKVLQEDDWVPGKDSTTKTVKSLLNAQPRWIRPKNREEMDRRIAGLSKGKNTRKAKRKLFQSEFSSDAPFDISTLTPPGTSPDSVDRIVISPPNLSPFPQQLDSRLSHLPNQNEQNQSEHTAGEPNEVFRGGYQQWWDVSAQTQQNITRVASDQGTLSTYFSTSSLRKRLADPKYSDSYLGGIVRLLDRYSISESSATTAKKDASIVESSDEMTLHPSHRKASSLTLPHAFLKIDHHKSRQGLCIPGFKSHDSKTCWCAVLDELGPLSELWVRETGITMDVSDPPQSLWNLDPIFEDDFGNGVLHLLAARGAGLNVIIDAIHEGIDINAQNTAGQTFLHLLLPNVLHKLAEDKDQFLFVLELFNHLGAKFHHCDLFGRSFFHILTHRTLNIPLECLLDARFLILGHPSTRDAFGWPQNAEETLDNWLATPASYIFPSTSLKNLPKDDSAEPTDPTPNATLNAETALSCFDRNFIVKQARLLEIAREALDKPHVEDEQGRNGLHCLAEASLMMKIDVEKRTTSRKRKRNQLGRDSPPSRLKLRYEMVQNLVRAGVNINHYNNQGDTVLMSFVRHVQDGEEDKLLEILLNHLITNGASIHSRNRQGETALHISVQLGRKVATRILLQNGANVHARTADGKGVQELGEKASLAATKEFSDQQLYASIMACTALAIQYGAVPSPTLVQEWSKKEGFAMYRLLQGNRQRMSEPQNSSSHIGI